jgi:hypothetical protein
MISTETCLCKYTFIIFSLFLLLTNFRSRILVGFILRFAIVINEVRDLVLNPKSLSLFSCNSQLRRVTSRQSHALSCKLLHNTSTFVTIEGLSFESLISAIARTDWLMCDMPIPECIVKRCINHNLVLTTTCADSQTNPSVVYMFSLSA